MTIKAFAIAIPLGLGIWKLVEAYEDSWDMGHFAWKKVGSALIFFGVMAILVVWLG